MVVVVGFPADVVAVLNGASARPALADVVWFFTQGAKFPELFDSLDDPAIVEGAFGTAPAVGDEGSDAYLWFGSQYASAFQVDPKSIVDVANVFDATMLVSLSVARARRLGRAIDGTELALALTRVSSAAAAERIPLIPPVFSKAVSALAAGDIDIVGASGDLDFDPATGEAPADVEIWKVQGGAFVTVAVVSP